MDKRTKTDYLVVHCSASTPKMDIGVKEITEWHVARGFRAVGYHFVIRRGGMREKGRDISDVGAHCVGHNHHSVGICLVGGVGADAVTPEDNFTKEQWTTLYLTLKELHEEYPKAVIVGHRDLDASKACPSFDVSAYIDDKPEFAPEA